MLLGISVIIYIILYIEYYQDDYLLTIFFSNVISTASSSSSLGKGDTAAFITLVPTSKSPVMFRISRYGLKMMPTKYALPGERKRKATMIGVENYRGHIKLLSKHSAKKEIECHKQNTWQALKEKTLDFEGLTSVSWRCVLSSCVIQVSYFAMCRSWKWTQISFKGIKKLTRVLIVHVVSQGTRNS